MKITLLSVGRLGASPENALARDWAARASQVGRSLGLGPVEIIEVEARGGKAGEGDTLLKRAGASILIACDEGGTSLPSREFAARLATYRDDGAPALTFVIGGADGLSPTVLQQARLRLAFGAQTWPHALARAMLAEQIYRAATILAGQPYHRD